MAGIKSLKTSLLLLASLSTFTAASDVVTRAADPCAAIGQQTWVSPSAVRACYRSVKVNETEKANILDVIEKSLAFHTSTNYQARAPQPFTSDVHEDILLDIARIRKQKYASDYDLHIDISRSVKRLNDGHCSWSNQCYVTLFVNYLPLPLILLTDRLGFQSVHIAPEAFSVASAEFGDALKFWQDALPGQLKGKLESLAGAKVLLINGKPPFDAVNDNAQIAGSYQALGTRQNGFFSSYRLVSGSWTYLLGNFAQQGLPLSDQVVLTVQRKGHILPETFVLPYRSKISSASKKFSDTASWRAQSCKALDGTNGVDVYAEDIPSFSTFTTFQQQPPVKVRTQREHPVNVMLDDTPLSNVALPPVLAPSLPSVSGSYGAAQFYMAKDGKTGILALGSFSDGSYDRFLNALLEGLLSLKAKGATQLIVDVSNNGGGYICAAHYLHRIIAGPKASTVPQAGLDSTARNGPLAQLIVKKIVNENADPEIQLLYNPLQWRDVKHVSFPKNADWLQPPVPVTINGRKDAFSQRLGQECQPEGFPTEPPKEALFDPKKVAIVSNGRCASSCSLFSIAMNKLEGSKTVVVGGKKDVKQQYCGTIGGQSTDFSTIDTEIKTAKLKNHTLAPPNLLVNGVFGITWRLAFGIDDPNQPAEWQNHQADVNLPLTEELANNPVAIWEEVIKRVL
ncbi:hypothetical protein CPC08DRAFT_636240 [Agrocybe pediades]|nr:hypothetical protein CPC08DRAFT_636240 [Agrocybe pediades]